MTEHTPAATHRRLPWVLGSGLVAIALVIGAGLANAGQRDQAPRGKALPFEKIDANGDGQISRLEADEFVAKEQAGADMNSDGAVSFEEAKAHRQAKREQRARDRYMRLDADGDGVVSVAEFQAPAGRIFERLDKNADGVISEDERPRNRMRHRRDRGQQE